MAASFEDHPFWNFSYAVYGRHGVSAALIGFQDRHGMDVNMLFLCLWAGQSGRGVLDDASFQHALRVSANWNPEIVCGLRALRIRLREGVSLVPKDMSDAIRQRILEIEIDCEHVEQLSLAAGVEATENPSVSEEQRLADCLDNLARYFDQQKLVAGAEDRADLITVLSAVFPDFDDAEIERRCSALLG